MVNGKIVLRGRFDIMNDSKVYESFTVIYTKRKLPVGRKSGGP